MCYTSPIIAVWEGPPVRVISYSFQVGLLHVASLGQIDSILLPILVSCCLWK